MCDVSLWFLCLAAGYGVLVVADKQTRPLDKLGRWVGGLILLCSIVGLIGSALCKFGAMKNSCPIMGGRTTLLGAADGSAAAPAAAPAQE
jgi:hypothetical protein